MNLLVKSEYLNTNVYIPLENRDSILRFVDIKLYPYLYKRYPEYFNLVCEFCGKSECVCKKVLKNKKEE